MGRRATPIILTDAEREQLQGLCRRRKSERGISQRAGIVLDCVAGTERGTDCGAPSSKREDGDEVAWAVCRVSHGGSP